MVDLEPELVASQGV